MAENTILDLGLCGRIPKCKLFQSYISTENGEDLVVSQTKTALSLGSWMYNAAACLAKYLETEHSKQSMNHNGDLFGKRVIELGAGTGIVGLMAGHMGADVTITDLDNLVPLIQYNIEQNSTLLKGKVIARALCWGEDTSDFLPPPDYLIIANCVYCEGYLEVLAQTMAELCDENTIVLGCYEERSDDIKLLIKKWHDVIGKDFEIETISRRAFKDTSRKYIEDFTKLVTMKKKLKD